MRILNYFLVVVAIILIWSLFWVKLPPESFTPPEPDKVIFRFESGDKLVRIDGILYIQDWEGKIIEKYKPWDHPGVHVGTKVW